MATATVSWIYEHGGTSVGGPGSDGGVSDAPPVTIDISTVGQPNPVVTSRYNDIVEVQVFWHPSAAANSTNFTGAAIYVEDPDMSSALVAGMDGTSPMDATQQDSGVWQPIFVGQSMSSPASVLVPEELVARDVRIYLCAFGPHTTATIV